MSSLRPLLRAVFWCVVGLSWASASLVSQQVQQPRVGERKAVEKRFGLLPLSFEANQGQSSSDAMFLAHGRGFSAHFKQDEAELLFAGGTAGPRLLRVALVNAAKHAAVSGEKRLPGTVNYFTGDDRARWHTGVPTFERLRYTDVYPGTDLIYYGNQGRLEFDFELSAGAAPSQIQMRFDGARTLRTDSKGDLVVAGEDGQVSFQAPVIYQPASGGRKDFVAGRFKVSRGDRVSFSVGRYDHTRPLIIDPILNYSTYLGPLAQATSIAVNQNGEAYVSGVAYLDFPTTPGSYQAVGVASTTEAGFWPEDGKPFVAKINSSGTALLYSTFLSGTGVDAANGVALDANGDAFVVGTTSSTNFPVTAGALQTKNNASKTTGFVAGLNATGAALLYSTYLGGSTYSTVTGVTIDASGDAYVAGSTQDADFPATAGAYRTAAPSKPTGSSSAFVAKINPTGTALVYASYLGGNQADAASAIATDSAGEAYVVGNTSSSNFPVTQGALQGARETSNLQAGFVAKFNAAGSALVYSTYLGGDDVETLTSVAVGPTGNAYVAGSTNSADFPVTAGAFQTKIGVSYFGYPQVNAYVTELNGSGTALVYSTLLGGGLSLGPYADEGDVANAIAVDGKGMVYVAGMACTGDFPVTTGAFEPTNLDGEIDGECTAFFTKLNPAPSTPLLYSTFLGGTGNGDAGDYFYGEAASGLALDASDNVYLAGFTRSVDFPVTAGVVETAFTGPSEEAFVTEFNASEMTALPVPKVTLTSNASSVLFGQPVTFTATVLPASGKSAPTGYVAFNFYQQEASDEEGSGVGFGPWTTVALNGAGVANFTTSSLEVLQTQVNAFYLGDANNAPASRTMVQTLADIPTVTTVTASANNVPYGNPVLFTATVLDNTGKPAKGLVFFLLGNLSYSEPTLDSNGHATWTNGTGGPPLSVGTDTVKVEYFPSTGYQASSGTLAETFTALGTTPDPTLSPPAGTYTSSQQVTLGDASSAAIIYYTTDGSTPIPGVSPGLPTGFNLSVNTSETVNAVAVASGYSPSNVVSAAYNIHLVPDFNLSLAGSYMTLAPGGSAPTIVYIDGVNGFSGVVSLACSGLPTGVTCAFSPASTSGTSTSQLIVAASTQAEMHFRPSGSRLLPLGLMAMAFGFIRMRRRAMWLLVLVACAPLLFALDGCAGGGAGGASSTPSTPTSHTYTVNVAGTSGSLSHAAPLYLTITN